MRIAICDDNKRFSTAFAGLISKFAKPGDEVFEFANGIELLESCRIEYPYDITFLDMDMPCLSGLEVAREIRCLSKMTIIVFLTEHPDYAVKASELRPMRYLLKPVSSKTILQILDEARIEASIPRELLLWQKKTKQTVAIRDIFYVDVFLKTLTFHTSQCKYTASGNLTDYSSNLEANGFYRINRSVMVNLEKIEVVDNRANMVRLRNGDALSVSKKKIVELTNVFCGRFVEENIIGL